MKALHLSVCKDCLTGDVAHLRNVLKTHGLPDGVRLRETACLGPCDKPSVLALNSAGNAGYVFAGVDLEGDAKDIAATCALYLASEKGWIEDARPCGRLRHLLVARMPA